MTIQSVRVVSKSIATCERFKQWLTANAEYHQGEIDILENDPVLFALRNTHSGLLLKIKGAPKDFLSLVIYTGLSRHIAVRYLENVIEDDGDEYLSALNSDTFERSDLHRALECFMARWDSLTPEESITTQPTIDTRKRIIDILRSHNTPNKPKLDFTPIDVTMTPKDIRIILGVKKMARQMNDVCQQQFNSSGHLRELLLRTKHLDTRVEYIDADGAKAISPTVRKLCEDLGVAVFETSNTVKPERRDHLSYAVKRSVDSLPDVAGMETVFENGKPVGKYAEDGYTLGTETVVAAAMESRPGVKQLPVGYTGNKDNHGFGSLDHCNW
ncbi:hypothetical protein PHABIO_415 [Pseudomonas phage Phabio]|uniref:Uncharacterized protein n=1 Tax=Pseudomonas phage Phabio TaxID=2006668 RepID=A0A1Y0SZE4_9CAUD|nr:hypothetical protein MZD05_gp415 [Pseudomonas phage Phabio]ARV77046.1 hypothetical protein PHABIO_415 [Pseudomonas phage Phabio]